MVNAQSLVGKAWDYGKQDCFTIVRDYYALLGLSLPDFERPADLEKTDSIFLRHAAELDFAEVDFDGRREGDVLIMKLGTRTPMHAAIYLTGDRILHQRSRSVSAIESFGRYYRQRVAAVFRHATCTAGR